MDNIQKENIRQEKPDNIFIIIGIIIINAYLLFFRFIPEEYSGACLFIFVLSIIFIVYLDNNMLIKSGFSPTISKAWVILFGAFFFFLWVFKRSAWIGDKARLFFWILLISISASFYYAYNSESTKAIAETACNLTTQIMNEQYKRPEVKCLRVVEINEIDANFYKARAIFNDGTTQNITMDVRNENGNKMVYVSLNPLGN
ncbi:hypothetical protein [Citrobacter sp. S-77]|uniref:hypothetical protein n=1 Tax=Citrobacter sp. S-77 TaxID=1080067 RepID=UPI0005EFDB59|nr:hypothetical protein [Citrobacter sp. S-77]